MHGNAVILGGSSGIGLATARALAADGIGVVIAARDPERLERAAAEVGPECLAVTADATDRADLARLAQAAGTIDILILAVSGALGAGPIDALDPAELREGFEAKFWAQVGAVQALLPALAPHASITFVTAGSARAALPGTSGLAAINGALEAMVGPLATELAPRRVNAVSPGVIRTPWWAGMPDDEREAFFARTAASLPVGRIGEAADVARSVALVATNPFITGTVLECDGGVHLASGVGLAA